MKKLASLVLAGAMAFSLAACGNNSTPAGGSSANAGTSTPAASTPASGGIEPIELTIYSPGNENSVFRVINQLMRLGARVVHQGNAKVHVSGHASAEELLHVYNIVQPRNVMPIHGEIRHLVANGGLAVKTGIAPENIVISPMSETE